MRDGGTVTYFDAAPMVTSLKLSFGGHVHELHKVEVVESGGFISSICQGRGKSPQLENEQLSLTSVLVNQNVITGSYLIEMDGSILTSVLVN